MKQRASSRFALVLAAAAFMSAGSAFVRDADACGGVFVPPAERPSARQIVRDHRIAIAIGRTKTVIWDEVRFDGNPRELAWVSPVMPGTKIELASSEWLDALETATQPIVYAPRDRGFGGCALTGCAESDDDFSTRSSPGVGVVVLNESTVGPYETVTIRSQGDPDAPFRWLTQNGYNVTPEVAPLLRSYAETGFDFAALRLRPNCTASKMEPVRLVMPGTVPKVLLRMALAGATSSANVTLFALAEAPHLPTSYPHGRLDDDALVWQVADERSNYENVARDAMSREGGKSWLIEAAKPAQPFGAAETSNVLPVPFVSEAYDQLCRGMDPSGGIPAPAPSPASPCIDERPPQPDGGDTADAGPDAADAGDEDDAGESDGGESADAAVPDAGDDAGSGPAVPGTTPGLRCKPAGLNDLELMRETVGSPNVIVTRMRASIPPSALTADLDLAPVATPSVPLSNLHQALRDDASPEERPSKSACASGPRRDPVVKWGPGAAALLALAAWLRRRSRH